MKYLIALIALAIPTYLIRFQIGGIPTTVLEIIIYLVFLYGFCNLAFCQWLKAKKKIWLPIGLLLLAALISVYIAPERLTALGQFKAYFLDPLLVFWLMICYLEKKDLVWVGSGLAGAALIVSGYSIYEKIIGQGIVDGRVIGIFGYSPNYVALFLVPIIVLLTTYNLQLTTKLKEKKNWRFLVVGCWLLVVINLYALYLSGSRGGMLAVLGGIIFYAIITIWPRMHNRLCFKIGLAIIILMAIVGAWFTFKPDFSASSGRVITSNNVRWQIWQASLELAMKNPILGIGLGNYQNAFNNLTKDRVNFPEYITPMAYTPHNVFLMFYLTTGLLGVIAFIWLLIVFYYYGFKNLKDNYAVILMAMMTAILLHGLVDAAYFKNDLSLIFWLIFGGIILLDDSQSEK